MYLPHHTHPCGTLCPVFAIHGCLALCYHCFCTVAWAYIICSVIKRHYPQTPRVDTLSRTFHGVAFTAALFCELALGTVLLRVPSEVRTQNGPPTSHTPSGTLCHVLAIHGCLALCYHCFCTVVWAYTICSVIRLHYPQTPRVHTLPHMIEHFTGLHLRRLTVLIVVLAVFKRM